jgi:hypothetical protein
MLQAWERRVMQNDFRLNSREKKMLFKRRLRLDDIIWLDLEEGCWKAGTVLTCFRMNSIGGHF